MRELAPASAVKSTKEAREGRLQHVLRALPVGLMGCVDVDYHGTGFTCLLETHCDRRRDNCASMTGSSCLCPLFNQVTVAAATVVDDVAVYCTGNTNPLHAGAEASRIVLGTRGDSTA